MSYVPVFKHMHMYEGMLEIPVSVKPAVKWLAPRCRTNSKHQHISRKWIEERGDFVVASAEDDGWYQMPQSVEARVA